MTATGLAPVLVPLLAALQNLSARLSRCLLPWPRKVYRVEHGTTGMGPFTYAWQIPSVRANRFWLRLEKNAVWPEGDAKLAPRWGRIPRWEQKHFIFGFAHPEDALEFFGMSALLWLSAHGFVLASYRVDRGQVLTGRHQLAFRADAARLVERVGLSKVAWP